MWDQVILKSKRFLHLTPFPRAPINPTKLPPSISSRLIPFTWCFQAACSQTFPSANPRRQKTKGISSLLISFIWGPRLKIQFLKV